MHGSVLQGLQEGFHIGVAGNLIILSSAHTHSFSRENTEVVLSYMHAELTAGRMLGLFQESKSLHFSPTGLVPKGHESAAWRMIVDFSHPTGGGVNDMARMHCWQ